MPSLLRHLILLGVAVPASLAGYHLYAGAHGSEGPPEVGSLTQAMGRLANRGGYSLSDLRLFEKDMWYVETRYVEPQRLDPELMFQHALDAVEREVPEVLFQREPKGKRLQISVGAFSTVLVLDPIEDFQALHEQLGRVAEVLDEHLSDDVKRPEVEYALVNGALSTLDPHTVLMPPVAAKEMGVDNDGEFGGLGIEITIEAGHLTVKQPLEGTPADRARLQADDQIVRIEGESTINMDLNDAVGKLRGPVGKPVTISVMRKGFEAPRDFTIIRDIIKLNPVEGKELPGGIVYLRIKNFNQNVDSDIQAILAKSTAKLGSIKGVVLDLRSNPGGYLNQAVDVSNRFLTEGVIVSTVEGGKSGRRDARRATAPDTEPDYPMAVLVNGSSASASEIVAGALRNLDRAVIIGERTFGKGSVQHLYENDDESQLKLTVAKYLTPGDQSIQSVGIPPDILLQPTVVRAPSEPGESPLISLYWREWVSHESDLDRHLEQVASADSAPAFSVRYLRPEQPEDSSSNARLDPAKDWEVQFAREVLLSAKSSRRAEVVASAAGVVARHQAEEAARIEAALKAQGIDWSAGPGPVAPKLAVKVDLGADGVLVAGAEEDVVLEVTNQGDAPVFQLSAVTKSDNPWLDQREFYLGRLDPGQTRRYTQKVALPEGYGTEVAPLTLTFRDPSHKDLLSSTELVHTQGRELPAFSYTLALKDDGSGTSKGDGDGLPEVGERVDLVVTVTNIGAGPTGEAFVRLKNHAGRALDLESGSIEVGEPKDAAGKACKPDTEGCSRQLEPGASYTDRLSFDLREPPENGAWELELSLGDTSAYDYASVQRGGFYSYFQLTETLKLKPGEAVDDHVRQEPIITITRRPNVEVQGPASVLSGKVTDPRGLRDVMVFRGDQKVFYQGGSPGLGELPFSVNQDLTPGSNLFVVLARNRDGLTSTQGFSTWYAAPGAQAASAPIKGEAEGTDLLRNPEPVRN